MSAKIRVDVVVVYPDRPWVRTTGWVKGSDTAVFKAEGGRWGVLHDWMWTGPAEVSGKDAAAGWKYASMRDALAAGEAK